ncbi:PfkB family carbohydrate kinase [Rhizobium sp. L1K21]|uniref:PfkB family carbohydrate kinase n=1 Tax=Rhizobium sp. L1K21 TaxID=2954933 RepID=UPI0020928FE1|nr:PfkB family carbohydrate kinase [Rhizobium sp. L1K21]MCO6187618.1 PfkB family carbohydrate kinase [Rhizobium sp. L1K21]
MAEPRLFHIGSAVIDYIYQLERLPNPGDDLLASDFAVSPGGGFNMLLAAKRSGMESCYAGKIGNGPAGALLEAALRAEGIKSLNNKAADIDTGTCIVLITSDGERTFISRQGAEAQMTMAELNAVPAAAGDWVFTSGYTLAYPECRQALARFIESLPKDRSFVLDPTGAVAAIPADILARVLKRADWLTCNEAEGQQIAGEMEGQALSQALLERFCPNAKGVVVRCGGKGAFLALRGQAPLFLPAFKVETIDTNGAGDVHAGAFIAALARGESPQNALRRANAAAAMSTTRKGGASAPTRQEVEAFLNRAQEAEIDRRDKGTGTEN